jgi:hypothetical protein
LGFYAYAGLALSIQDIISAYQNIIDVYRQNVDDLNKIKDVIIDDYNDNLTVNHLKPNEFNLQHTPQHGSTRLFINSEFYNENDEFILDYPNKKLYWMFTLANGGFDLEDDFDITAVYDYYIETNP